jgi:hypothetical protein
VLSTADLLYSGIKVIKLARGKTFRETFVKNCSHFDLINSGHYGGFCMFPSAMKPPGKTGNETTW